MLSYWFLMSSRSPMYLERNFLESSWKTTFDNGNVGNQQDFRNIPHLRCKKQFHNALSVCEDKNNWMFCSFLLKSSIHCSRCSDDRVKYKYLIEFQRRYRTDYVQILKMGEEINFTIKKFIRLTSSFSTQLFLPCLVLPSSSLS